MAPTPYVKQTWIDGDSTKPTSAARLGVIETGVFDAHYRPSVSVTRTTAQTIPNSAATVLTFNTEQYDTDGMHSTVTNTGRLTAVVAGKYRITGRISFVANVTGTRDAILRLNGTTTIDHWFDAAANVAMYATLGRDYQLSASDYIEFVVTQTSGAGLDTGSGIADLHFEMHLASY